MRSISSLLSSRQDSGTWEWFGRCSFFELHTHQGVRAAAIAVKLRADANIVQIRFEMLRAVDFSMLHKYQPSSRSGSPPGSFRTVRCVNRLQLHIVEIADAFTQQRAGKYLMLPSRSLRRSALRSDSAFQSFWGKKVCALRINCQSPFTELFTSAMRKFPSP